MPTPIVIDLSHWNTIPTGLVPAKDAGIVGVIHKLTEGTGSVDDKCAARFALANDADMLWGLYHFIRPGDAKKQAEFMFSKAMALKVYDEQTLWVLDWEDAGVTTANALTFLNRIAELTGRGPVLYSGHVVKDAQNASFNEELTGYKLWLCHYTTGLPTLPKGFESYWLWQYTDKGDCPGVNSPVDLNAITIPADQFVEDWTGEAVLPPDELVVSVIISAPEGVRVEVQVVNGDTNGTS